MATISSPSASPAIAAAPGASGYRMAGLEITLESTLDLQLGLVVLGSGAESQISQMPSDIILDRVYIHGTPRCACKRGVGLNGVRQAVIESYISDIHSDFQDSQAIAGWSGPGPFRIVNNYLEASGENIMFGGADPSIQYRAVVQSATASSATLSTVANLAAGDDVTFTISGATGPGYTTVRSINGNMVTFDALPSPPDIGGLAYWGPGPADIEVKGNYMFKPLSWKPGHPTYAGRAWVVKNLFELKDGQRVLVDGNIFENCWVSGQTGIGVLLKSANDGGNCPQCTTRDVTFRNSLIRNTEGGGFLIQGAESYSVPNRMPGSTKRLHIDNALVYPPVLRLISIFNYTTDVLISHMTGLSSSLLVTTNYEDGVNNARFAIRDSILQRNEYGFGHGAPEGQVYMERYFQPYTMNRLMLINTSTDSSSRLVSAYPFATVVDGMAGAGFVNPAGMLADYHGLALGPGSIGRGAASDGKDLGVDMTALDNALLVSSTGASSASLIVVTPQPSSISLESKQGGSIQSQQVVVTAVGAQSQVQVPVNLTALSVVLSPSTACTTNWLTVTPNLLSSSITVTVSANPAGLTAATICTGALVLSASGATPVVVPVTFAVTAAVVVSPLIPETAGLVDGWSVSRKLVINRSQVQAATPLANFPMLVNLTDLDLRSSANGGKVAKSDGADLRFTDSAGTKLSHEIESYDPVTGKLTAWVNIPSLSAAADTVLYLKYGNATATNQQNRIGVWDSSFRMVQHFSGSDTATSADSTSYANNAAISGSLSKVTGLAGSAYQFSAANRLAVAPSSSWNSSSDNFTIEYWMKSNQLQDYRAAIAVGSWGSSFNHWFYSSGYGIFRMDTTVGFCQVPAFVPVDNAFHHIVVSQNRAASRASVYVDGRLANIMFCAGAVRINGAKLSIGGFEGGLSQNVALDEVRISVDGTRSADWIATQYNNQRNPAAFSSLLP